MKIIDPMSFFGIDSGMRRLVVTKAEAATLLRAVAILERGHALVTDRNPDHQGESEDLGDALCTGPGAIRRLAEEGIDLW